MSNFLHTLAARTLGPAESVVPRMRSLFEPEPGARAPIPEPPGHQGLDESPAQPWAEAPAPPANLDTPRLTARPSEVPQPGARHAVPDYDPGKAPEVPSAPPGPMRAPVIDRPAPPISRSSPAGLGEPDLGVVARPVPAQTALITQTVERVAVEPVLAEGREPRGEGSLDDLPTSRPPGREAPPTPPPTVQQTIERVILEQVTTGSHEPGVEVPLAVLPTVGPRGGEAPPTTPPVAQRRAAASAVSPQAPRAGSRMSTPSPLLARVTERLIERTREVAPGAPADAIPVATLQTEPQVILVRPQIIPRSVAPHLPEPPRALAERPGQAPTIHVSIGRIEVRATQKAGAAPQQRPAPPAPSLDDYLRQRTMGGGR